MLWPTSVMIGRDQCKKEPSMHVGDSEGMELGRTKNLSESGWMDVVILVLNYLGTSYKVRRVAEGTWRQLTYEEGGREGWP